MTPTTSTPTGTTPTGTTPTTSGGGTVTAIYQVFSDWQNGFVAQVTVTNNAPRTITAWTVTWTFAGNQQVANSWNTRLTQSGGSVIARNASYSGTLAPGQATSFGFLATYSGRNVPPTLSASGS